MFRKLTLATLALFAVDGMTTALAPATGLSLTQEAQAADFTGKIKRIKIKKRRSGDGFKVTTRIQDDGDASAVDAASLTLEVCTSDGKCTDPIELDQDEYVGSFKTGRFAYDGATVPEGEYAVATNLLNADGKAVGMSQTWSVTAKGGEMSVVAQGEVDGKPYISELSMTSDDCGNGRAKARIEGADADSVVTVELVDLKGTLLSTDDDEACADGTCVTGTLKAGKTAYTDSEATFGEIGKALAASEKASVTLVITAYNDDGKLLGYVETEAVAKYGDILIDGVPLEFD